MIKVCHITSVHPKEDVRIFQKECISLAKAGYEVTLVQQGESYEKGGVQIVGFGKVEESRLKRMLVTSRRAYQAALEVDADVYHLHDPELLFYAKKLKKRGKVVIFDSHEDVPADILEKYWIPASLRTLISKVYAAYEASILKKMDGIVGVTPSLCDRLRRCNQNTAMVTNYPIWIEGLPEPQFREKKVIFPGLICHLWGLDTLVKALAKVSGVTLELRSRTVEEGVLPELQAMPGWKQVHFPGKVSHAEVMRLMTECLCGMALCRPCPNVGGSLGTLGVTKIFEYMMAGIPVICSDLVLWKEIIDQWHCGICVDPEDVDAVADAIQYFVDHPEKAKEMGENGRRAVRAKYNWAEQEKVLLSFYEKIV